jgi:hypothetical protein
MISKVPLFTAYYDNATVAIYRVVSQKPRSPLTSDQKLVQALVDAQGTRDEARPCVGRRAKSLEGNCRLWDDAVYCLFKTGRSFGGAYYFHHQVDS